MVVAAIMLVALVVIILTGRTVPTSSRSSTTSGPPPASAPSSVSPEGTLTGFAHYAATVRVPRIIVRQLADPSAPVTMELNDHNENGVPQTFLIKSQERGRDGSMWYQVALPVRPNGTTGWVLASEVDVTGIDYEVVVHLSAFRLQLFQGSRVLKTIAIGVGTDQTPTPGGEYYIKELLKPPRPDTVYGDFVFGLSGFSNVLTTWPQGGVLGIHGTNDPRYSIGRKVSHGCIRMANADIDWLASLLPLGTPVEVEQ